MKQPKDGEYWVAVHADTPTVKEVVRVSIWFNGDSSAYPCGDEQGWPIKAYTFIRKVRL